MINEQQAAQDTTKAAGSSQDQVVPPPAQVEADKPAEVAPEVKATESGNEPAKQEASKEDPKAESKGHDKFDLKLPEDSQLDASAIERIAAYAKERGLTNDQAQEILNRENDAVSSFAKAQAESVKATMNEWQVSVQKDKELGGDNFNRSVELAKRVATKYGTEDFIKALNETGLGNHPELVRVFFRIGKAMGEDKLVVPNAQSSGQKRSIEEMFYNETKQI